MIESVGKSVSKSVSESMSESVCEISSLKGYIYIYDKTLFVFIES